MRMERKTSGTSQRRSMTGKPSQPVPLSLSICHKFFRRIGKISDYYSRLGVNLIFEKCPRLRGHLANEYDDELINKVPFHTIHQSPAH
jgi:hypothetical protein